MTLEIKRLDSGYWFARWSGGFAQWPIGRTPTRDDFFQPSWSYSEARVAELVRRVAAQEK